jgi:hypothetical protein
VNFGTLSDRMRPLTGLRLPVSGKHLLEPADDSSPSQVHFIDASCRELYNFEELSLIITGRKRK